MGCDIHIHVECKHGAHWKRCNREIYEGRDYELFGILAGVRGSRTPISYPKGLPVDVTYDVKRLYDLWEWDTHSSSWLTFDEIWDSLSDCHNHSLQLIALDMLGAKREAQAEDVRIVFWFDS